MMKRDLKADLGWLSSPICGHILKRAIEAEALARELADALRGGVECWTMPPVGVDVESASIAMRRKEQTKH